MLIHVRIGCGMVLEASSLCSREYADSLCMICDVLIKYSKIWLAFLIVNSYGAWASFCGRRQSDVEVFDELTGWQWLQIAMLYSGFIYPSQIIWLV